MSHYCELLARKYGLSAERCDLVRTASPMHDIGKIGTPDHVLLKPGKFTMEEFNVISQHAEIGYLHDVIACHSRQRVRRSAHGDAKNETSTILLFPAAAADCPRSVAAKPSGNRLSVFLTGIQRTPR